MHEVPEPPYRPLDEADGPWQVRLDYAVLDGRIECVGLHIKPLSRVERLNADVLRRIPLARLAKQDALLRIEQANELLVEAERSGDTALKRRARYLADNLPQAGRPGRKPDPERHYRAVAEKYMKAVRAGVRSPTKHLADHEPVAYSTAASWVREARKRGLIPPTTRGKITWPGGEGE